MKKKEHPESHSTELIRVCNLCHETGVICCVINDILKGINRGFFIEF